MDAGGLSSAFNFNIAIFTEPRGFIKILEFVLSIFAFATTTSPDSSTKISVDCSLLNSTGTQTRTFSFGYPFDLEDVCITVPICNSGVAKKTFCLLEGSQSSAQFYVFVGVIVFLYCLAALVLYVFFDDLYRRNTRIIIIDFVASIVLTMLWLIASSAWASGVNDVKMYTDPNEGHIFKNLEECVKEPKACTTVDTGNFASLNVSIIFGFLNFLVWIGNLWFLYKETPWFKVQAKPTTAPDTVYSVDSTQPGQSTTPTTTTARDNPAPIVAAGDFNAPPMKN